MPSYSAMEGTLRSVCSITQVNASSTRVTTSTSKEANKVNANWIRIPMLAHRWNPWAHKFDEIRRRNTKRRSPQSLPKPSQSSKLVTSCSSRLQGWTPSYWWGTRNPCTNWATNSVRFASPPRRPTTLKWNEFIPQSIRFGFLSKRRVIQYSLFEIVYLKGKKITS